MDTVAPKLALLGNPNCGKTALFNLLTGTRQKVANYAGVTVERKSGWVTTPAGHRAQLLDLPGTYSLAPLSHDEVVTRDVVTGRLAGEARPDLLVCVADATNLQLNLRLVLEAQALGLPMVLVLNMFDVAQAQGMRIDHAKLGERLGMPVVTAVSVHGDGAKDLLAQLDASLAQGLAVASPAVAGDVGDIDPVWLNTRVRELLADVLQVPPRRWALSDRIDRWAMHPFFGYVLLAALLMLMFQAVFAWAAWPMDAIEAGMGWLGEQVSTHMADGPLRSLLVDGVIAGAGGVLVFLPQILILFFFIFLLEDTGYLPRAAFLMDRVMGTVGLSGRSFIPLLSSFACAVPGIMATRTISHWRDRWLTILVAPLMTCSARLPVYALLIAAFIPQREVAGLFNLQGLVLFGLYVAGIVSAMAGGLHRLAPHGGRAADAAADGTAGLPPAQRAQHRARPLGARQHLRQAGRRHHPGADGVAVVPFQLPRAARRLHRAGGRIQRRGSPGAFPGTAVCAAGLRLAHRGGADSGDGRARGRGRGAGHGVRAERLR